MIHWIQKIKINKVALISIVVALGGCLCCLVGCRSTQEIQITDTKGQPLNDTIICQWNRVAGFGYSLLWKTKLYKTDSDGKAIIYTNLDTIVGKIGYFPVNITASGKSHIKTIVLPSSSQGVTAKPPYFHYLDSPTQIEIYYDWLDYIKWLQKQPEGNHAISSMKVNESKYNPHSKKY